LVKLGYTTAYRAGTRHRARSCPPACAARRTAASTSGLARAFPRPPLPKAGSTPRCLEVSPRHVPRRPSLVGRTTMEPCAYQDEAVRRSVLVSPETIRPSPIEGSQSASRVRPRRPAPQAATAPPWPPTASSPLHATGRPFVHTLATTTLHHSLQSCGLLGRAGIHAGSTVPAATAAWCRRPPSPAAS
jgi:hypothetical protein